MEIKVHPGHPLRGEVWLPGDKSISHRAALFAALPGGQSRFANFLSAGVTEVMLEALTNLGVRWEQHRDELVVWGKGISRLRAPVRKIDCGNSGTTLRLLAGALAGANLPAVLDGSVGLRRRPMQRVVEPLQAMGAHIESSPAGTAPLKLVSRHRGESLHAVRYSLAVASAQVKSAVLLAGLAADGPVTVIEPSQSRDHTERMLAAMGVHIDQQKSATENSVTLQPLENRELDPLEMVIPGDFSSASFLIVAGLVTPGSEILIRQVGLNPTRTGLLEVLWNMGADIEILNENKKSHEPLGDIRVRCSNLKGVKVGGEQVVRMIDEFPILAAAAAYADGETVITQAEELHYKESDRISAICSAWRGMDIAVEELPDGFMIQGGQTPHGGAVDPCGDHRLAMSLVVCGLGAQKPTTVAHAEIIHESYPEFFEDLRALGGEISYG